MKKKLAIILSVVMMLSLISVPVSAAPGELVAEGNVVVIPHVIAVTLPTTAFSFVVDTEGLIGDNDPGAITFAGGATPSFINRSSAPVLLGVEARITTTSGNTAVVPVATEAAVEVGTARNVHVTVTPSTANVATAGGTFTGSANRTPLALAPTLLNFLLPAANFDVTGEPGPTNGGLGTLVRVLNSATPNLTGTQIQFAGTVNPNADWALTDVFGLRVRFSFTEHLPAVLPTAMPNSAHLVQILPDSEVFAPNATDVELAPPISLTRGANVVDFDWASHGATVDLRPGTVTIGGVPVTMTAGSVDRGAGRMNVTVPAVGALSSGTHPMVVNVSNAAGATVATVTLTVIIP